MKYTNGFGKKMYCLWTSFVSDINHRSNKNDSNNKSEDTENCTLVSGLDLSGMNKEQAKAELDKIISKKLEKVSTMEFSELEINAIEKERRKANADKRIAERRNIRKQKKSEEVQLVIKDESIIEDCKQASIFDVIQPETYTTNYGENQLEKINLNIDEIHPEPFDLEEEAIEEPIKGQISMFESSQEEVNTSIDSAIDKVFEFYGSNAARLVQIYHNAKQLLQQKLTPLFIKIDDKLELKNKLYSINNTLAGISENASDKMYTFVEFIDRKNEAASSLISQSGKKFKRLQFKSGSIVKVTEKSF